TNHRVIRSTQSIGLWALCALVLLFSHAPAGGARDGVTAVRAGEFLGSLGANSAISARGESLQMTIDCARYLGLRWFRAGIEGDIPIRDFVELRQKTGVRFSWGLGSGGSELGKLIRTGREVAAADALLAFEGP